MLKRNFAVIGLAAASILMLSLHAQAHGGPPGMGHHHGPMMGGGAGRVIPLLLHSADLTSDQQTQAHQILEADRPNVQPLLDQLRQANKDLTSLLLSPQVQTDAVTAQQAQIAQLRQQLAQHELTVVTAIRALLSPDQIAKAAAAKDQKHAWHHGDQPCASKTPN